VILGREAQVLEKSTVEQAVHPIINPLVGEIYK
jgi:hypothetical protein